MVGAQVRFSDMSEVASEPDVGRCPFLFDPLAGRELLDPYPTYAAARQHAPVVYSETLGLWFMFRHADVVEAIRDTETFSSQFVAAEDRVADRLGRSHAEAVSHALVGGFPDESRFLLTTDAPAHHVRRKLAQQAFTPRRVSALEPLIADRTEELCGRLASGATELMGTFAYPLTSYVIAGILGVGDQLAERMRQVAEDLLVTQAAGRRRLDEAAAAEMITRLGRISEMHSALRDELRLRRSDPTDDVLSALATTSLADGTSLSDPDILAMVTELILAGTDTTANQIAHTVIYATESPELWRSLAGNRELTESVVEESLRRRGSSKGLLRVVTRDVEVAGTTIPAGSVVQLLYGSANHDESVFAQPRAFQPDRAGLAGHLAFGRGVHFCLGAPLARLELRVATQVLSRRFPRLRVATDPVTYLPALTTHTIAMLEVLPGPTG
jgi:cytochrome P450